jgi:protein ImuB
MERALCIWIPAWPLQRLAAARAELRPQAVLVYRLHATRGARVVAYSAPLAAAPATPWIEKPHTAGIRADMPLAEATALASFAESAAPRLELHDPLADRLALESLAEWCQRFSPSVGVEEGDAPESLLLDVSGVGPLVGGEQALAERVVREFHKRHLTARVAIADTVGAAWGVAHFAELPVAEEGDNPGHGLREGDSPDPVSREGDSPDHGSRRRVTHGALPRKIGTDTAAILAALRVPLVVSSRETWAALAPLSVAALRLPEETCGLLAELGLRRIDQVAALARSTLLARFGPAVLARLDQATGAAAEAIAARTLPAECRFEWLFEHPTGRREMIELALDELVARACGALATERRGVLRMRCRFETLDRHSQEFVVGLYRPSANLRHVGELARLKLEPLRFVEPVASICLTVLAADRLEYRQREIFAGEESRREASRELAALVDRLGNRLGSQAVLRPWLLTGAQPEFTCQYQPMASLSARKKNGTTHTNPKRKRGNVSISQYSTGGQATRGTQSGDTRGVPGDRPLHLRSRPLRLAVMSLAPEGPPIRFRLAGHDHRVARYWGPERIETGWWRTRCVRRDYYQVETTGGQRFWLFRELNSGGWFLHGEFC